MLGLEVFFHLIQEIVYLVLLGLLKMLGQECKLLKLE